MSTYRKVGGPGNGFEAHKGTAELIKDDEYSWEGKEAIMSHVLCARIGGDKEYDSPHR